MSPSYANRMFWDAASKVIGVIATGSFLGWLAWAAVEAYSRLPQ